MHSNAIWPQRAADLLPFAQRIRNRMRRRNGSRVRVKLPMRSSALHARGLNRYVR